MPIGMMPQAQYFPWVGPWGRRHVITNRADKRVSREQRSEGKGTKTFSTSSPSIKGVKNHSRDRENSSPNALISPKTSWRRTLAVMGGVMLGTKLEEEADGAGIVSCTV